MNYFSAKSAAERYARGRPRFHSFIVEKIKEFISPENFRIALDVGCGTGLSTEALLKISEKVIGIDISAAMVALSARDKNLEYVLASAESLPFCDDKFDLITVSQAIHWFDRDKFFAEADRVLKAESWLVAYDNYFTGQMSDNAGFNLWYRDEYLKKFPSPPRGKLSFETKSEKRNDFILIKEDWSENFIELSLPETIDYLITQSNVITQVEGRTQTIEDVTEWLTTGIKPFFETDARKSFLFIAPIRYLRRSAE